MEFIPGVHRLERVRGCNIYLLVERELAVIDTGWRGNTKAILGYIQSIGRQPQELKWIFITHNHPDHAGSASELQALTGALVVAHSGDVHRNGENGSILLPPMRVHRSRLFPKASTKVDLVVEDGELLPCLGGLRVIHTPGHTPGSIALYLLEKKALFPGDVILNGGHRLHRPLVHLEERDRYETSLQKLAALPVEVCCFAHGEPLRERAWVPIKELAGHIPTSARWQRVVRNPRRLVQFFCRMFSRR
ncbi:MAG: MBL fold metallo-hydrolase [Chloroflexi bacterium]|nr:MBL fold metallo-hydrolase [Chloroflexota bacterium]